MALHLPPFVEVPSELWNEILNDLQGHKAVQIMASLLAMKAGVYTVRNTARKHYFQKVEIALIQLPSNAPKTTSLCPVDYQPRLEELEQLHRRTTHLLRSGEGAMDTTQSLTIRGLLKPRDHLEYHDAEAMILGSASPAQVQLLLLQALSRNRLKSFRYVFD